MRRSERTQKTCGPLPPSACVFVICLSSAWKCCFCSEILQKNVIHFPLPVLRKQTTRPQPDVRRGHQLLLHPALQDLGETSSCVWLLHLHFPTTAVNADLLKGRLDDHVCVNTQLVFAEPSQLITFFPTTTRFCLIR